MRLAFRPIVASPARSHSYGKRSPAGSAQPLWPSAGQDADASSVRRKVGRRDAEQLVDPDAVTLPSYKKRRELRLFQFLLFACGVLMGVAAVFAGEIEGTISESRMWVAHELRAMKMHPTDEDLALPRPYRMLARTPRKHRISTPSVKGVPVLDVSELPPALRISP